MVGNGSTHLLEIGSYDSPADGTRPWVSATVERYRIAGWKKLRRKTPLRIRCHTQGGKGTEKQCVLVTAQRQGQIWSALVASDQGAELLPLVECFVYHKAHLMTDKDWANCRSEKTMLPSLGLTTARKSLLAEICMTIPQNRLVRCWNELIKAYFIMWVKNICCVILNEIVFRWGSAHSQKYRNQTSQAQNRYGYPDGNEQALFFTNSCGRKTAAKDNRRGVRVPFANLSSV